MVVWLREAMRREGLVWENGPDVSVNANTSDSHYEPTADRAAPIREGDFLLIDIWGRLDSPTSIYYDITWTGVVGREPHQKNSSSSRYRPPRARRRHRRGRVSLRRRTARSAASKPTMPPAPSSATPASPNSSPTAPATTSPTRFTAPARTSTTSKPTTSRRILPNTCFSVEPGIYLPEFGVRSEVNMLTAPGKAWVTGRIQQELVRI